MKRWWVLSLLVAVIVLGVTPVMAAPGDIEFERKGVQGGPVPPATFSHWSHRIRYRCYVCHPKLFVMKAGGNEITMKTIGAGKTCGACHNGKAAFKVEFRTCSRCHATPGAASGAIPGAAEAPAPAAAPKPAVTPAPAEAPPAKK